MGNAIVWIFGFVSVVAMAGSDVRSAYAGTESLLSHRSSPRGSPKKIQWTTASVPGEVVVRLKKAEKGARLQPALLAALRARYGKAVLAMRPFITDERLQTLKFSDQVDLSDVVKTLNESAQVEFAEPNFIYRALDTGLPDDPEFTKLWGMNNSGQADSSGQAGTLGMDINVMPLWAEGHRGSKNVRVAVIDTGIDWTHPDLKDNLFTNAAEIAGDGIDNDGNGFVDDIHGWNFVNNSANSSDDNDHGSHCAGTIGGVGNNGTGVTGVNWNVSFMPVKFLSADGSGSLQAAVESINYATQMKVNVMSNSWGGGGFSKTLQLAIENARDAGIAFFAAAGNETNNNDASPTYPAGYTSSNVISVAAVDNRAGLASFSNWGAKTVHIAAPGVRILSSVKGGGYKSFSGTSMATPHAAGVAALMLSIDSGLKVAEIKERLIKTSTPLFGLRTKTISRGLINADNAVKNRVPPSPFPDDNQFVPVTFSAESAHPYVGNDRQSWTVHEPGAKFIRVHFAKIDTEANFDTVSVETPAGEVIQKISGQHTNLVSDYVAGDTLVIKFTSDNVVQGWGFSVDAAQVVR